MYSDDCHEGATRESPIDLSPLRELSGCVRSMQQELKSVQEGLQGQGEQRMRDREIALAASEDNRKQLQDLQKVVKELKEQQSRTNQSMDCAVKELRDKQSQVHHDLNGAVEELKERHAHFNMVQNNEKRKVSWLTSRLDNVEDRLTTIDESIKSSDGRTQGRFDSMAAVMQQILQTVQDIEKNKPGERAPAASAAATEMDGMDYSFTCPVQRNVSSMMTTPGTSSTFHTARSNNQSYRTAEEPSSVLSSEVFATPKPTLSSTKKSQVVIHEEPMVVDPAPALHSVDFKLHVAQSGYHESTSWILWRRP